MASRWAGFLGFVSMQVVTHGSRKYLHGRRFGEDFSEFAWPTAIVDKDPGQATPRGVVLRKCEIFLEISSGCLTPLSSSP